MIKAQSLIEASENRLLKFLVYGDYGTGKTRLLGTSCLVPELQDVLYLDSEAGVETLLEFKENTHIARINVTNTKELDQTYKFLLNHLKLKKAGDFETLGQLNTLVNIPPEFRISTVVIDSLTEMNQDIMYKTLSIDSSNPNLDADYETAEFKQWNQGYNYTLLTVRVFRNQEVNLLVACGMHEVDGINVPNLPGKLSRVIQGLPDIVGQMVTEQHDGEDIYALHLSKFNKEGRIVRAAKNRLQELKVKLMVNPTMEKILQNTTGENTNG